MTSSSLAAISRKLENAYGIAVGTYSPEGLRARLHIIDSEIAEGFFADTVVLVEGKSDKAALIAAARLNGIDFEAKGIAVLVADGKNSLDRPASIFQEFSIPTYLIWDCDRNTKGGIEDLRANHALQLLSGCNPENIFDAKTIVSNKFACFEYNIEHTLKLEIGDILFEDLINKARDTYGIIRQKDVLKIPAAMTSVLLEASKNGARAKTVDDIVNKICEM
ncbi:ATP-dependent endonuclease [Methylobacterium sp. BTF04]|nr:ATP-dependent endonuclease [Methylobacterium sp. BTF04]